jgi:hypothetical protein
MASGDKAASKAGHMAAPTTTGSVSNTLVNGEPSTHGAMVAFCAFGSGFAQGVNSNDAGSIFGGTTGFGCR